MCDWSTILLQWSFPTNISPVQGNLDVKYLQDRYQRGKAHIEEVLAAKHRAVHHPSICLGHTSIVQMQGELGPDGFLVQKLDNNHCTCSKS